MYIANQVDEAAMGAARASPTDFLQTRISLNGGADWRPLPPPASFRFPACNACQPGAAPEQCSLHLHGPTSWFAPEGAPPLLSRRLFIAAVHSGAWQPLIRAPFAGSGCSTVDSCARLPAVPVCVQAPAPTSIPTRAPPAWSSPPETSGPTSTSAPVRAGRRPKQARCSAALPLLGTLRVEGP